MSEQFKRKMEMASKMWSQATQRAKTESFGSDLEDGRYEAALSEGKIVESQSSGRLQVAWAYTILQGENKGQTVRDYDGLETEDNLMWLARKLSKLGYEVPEDLEEVEAVLVKITKEKPKVRIRLKMRGEYQNVYIDKVLRGDEVSEDGDGEEESASESPEDGGEAVPDTVELAVGTKVVATLSSGSEITGTVEEILEAEGKARIKTETGKVYRLLVDRLSVVEEESVSGEEVPETPEEDVEEEKAAPARVVKRSPSLPKKEVPKKKGRR